MSNKRKLKQERSEVSLVMQKADITLPIAQCLLTRQPEVFLAS